jgi:hypothetical protein
MSPDRATRPRIVDLVALSVVALTGVLVGLYVQPTSPPNPIASPGASTAAAGPSPAPTPRRSAGPNDDPPALGPTDSPLVPCDVPEHLPGPPGQPAAPRIQGRNVAMLFSSPLYRQDVDGSVYARRGRDAAFGVWFAPPGAKAARLLVAAEGGAVLPLALSPAGDAAAVWYLPARRDFDDPACPTGIYLVSTTDGSSRLILEGDWAAANSDGPDRPTTGLGQTWTDQRTRSGSPRFFRLPVASFSANGRNVALVNDEGITVWRPGRYSPVRHLPGHCSTWGWAPERAVFVAGCQEVTSLWRLDVASGFGEDIYPLPLPREQAEFRHWNQWPASTVGVTPRGDIRVVRFYGFATGCEVEDCFIPSPAWSVTTIDPITGESRSRVTEIDVLTSIIQIGRDARLSADASWVYVRDYGDSSRVVSIDSGVIVKTRRLGEAVGASSDGRFLFGSGISRDREVVVVRSLDRTGTRREVATIAWPQGVDVPNPVIDVMGLAISQP